MFPAGAAPLVSALMFRLLVKLSISAVMVIVAGRVAAVPPFTVVLSSVLLSTTSLAASVASGPRPEMVTVPARPAVLVLLSLVLAMNDCGWPLISVPSGFTFARSVLTLSAMLPAGAALGEVATIVAGPVTVMVSGVL